MSVYRSTTLTMAKSTLLLLAVVLSATVHGTESERGITIKNRDAKDRVALVIGNSGYSDAPLRNPANDANAMTALLTQLGFDVITVLDGDRRAMLSKVNEFGTRLQNAKTGLFYYAGHGLQIDGLNYLVPIGADMHSEGDAQFETLELNRVIAKMDSAVKASPNLMNIVILDACRNNPFARSWRSAGGGGLAQVDAPTGTIIAYATAPGTVAADGDGNNGLYTSQLLHQMQQPGMQIEEVFKRVRIGVVKESGGKQTPWESSSLTGNFTFVGETEQISYVAPPAINSAPAPGGAGGGAMSPEVLFWDDVRDKNDVGLFQLYLEKYPSGIFVPLANREIKRIGDEAAAAADLAERKRREQARLKKENEARRIAAAQARKERERRAKLSGITFDPGATLNKSSKGSSRSVPTPKAAEPSPTPPPPAASSNQQKNNGNGLGNVLALFAQAAIDQRATEKQVRNQPSSYQNKGNINGWRVKQVNYGDGRSQLGSFRLTSGKSWVEQGKNSSFRFTERNRDEWSVYLYDSSRGVSIQLDLHTGKVYYKDRNNSAKRTLYQVMAAY